MLGGKIRRAVGGVCSPSYKLAGSASVSTKSSVRDLMWFPMVYEESVLKGSL